MNDLGSVKSLMIGAEASNSERHVISEPLLIPKKHGLYDVIIIQGGVQKISKNLKDQLKDGGRIISIFTDGAMGQCFLGIKRGSDITWRSEFDASAPIIKDFTEPKSFTFV